MSLLLRQVLASLDEMNSIWFEDYYQKKLPDRGFMLVSWPSRSDASLAPEGHHCLNLVTFAPYELAEGDWDSLKEQYLENQLDLLEKKFGLDVRDHITVAKVNTPRDPTIGSGIAASSCILEDF